MESSNLTFEQLRLVFVVYSSSVVPLVLIPYLFYKNKISINVIKLYVAMFIVCALGWELWFTYGWIDGFAVDLRRADILNYYLPKNINWILNSLADSGTICLGGLLITKKILKNNLFIYKWSWKAFSILFVIFILQNILVELFLYHDQLSDGKLLSWAPLSPLGKYINPLILSFNERTIMLQNQIPWIIMTPLFYLSVIFFMKREKS